MKKAIQICFIALVVVLLFVPGVFANREENRLLESEKRFAANLPTASIFTTEWGKQLEDWLNDNLALREHCIGVRSALLYLGLQVVESEEVIRGKDGWLFYNKDDNMKIITGEYQLSEEKLAQIASSQQAISNYYKSIGKKYILFLSPSKVSLYPEYLYGNYAVEDTAIDIVEQYLKENTDVIVVNAKTKMVDNKDKGLVAFKTDTHWTSLGAYYGYLSLIDFINQEQIAQITPVQVTQAKGSREIEDDLTELLGCAKYVQEVADVVQFPKKSYSILSGEYYDELRKSLGADVWDFAIYGNDSGNGLNMHIYGNSRFLPEFQILQMLAEDFSRVVYTWTDRISKEIDSVANADVVVYVCGERFLNQNLDSDQGVVALSLPEVEIRNVTEANGWNNGLYIDLCNGEYVQDNETSITQAIGRDDSKCTLTGWAVDFASEGCVSDIYIRLGENITRGTYGIERVDISDYWGSVYKNCGFAFNFPASFFYDEEGNLVSELEVILVGKDRSFMYEPIVYELGGTE